MINLNWSKFPTSTIDAFKNLSCTGNFADVTLACADGQQIEAHKIVLSSCSPFFQNILLQNPHQHPLLYMKGINIGFMQSLIKFVYSGEVEIKNENLEIFLEIADDLQIAGLTKMAEDDEQMKVNGDAARYIYSSADTCEQSKAENKLKIKIKEESTNEPLPQNRCTYENCNKQFSTKANMKTHTLAIHESKMFTCAYCPFKSGFRQNLNRHMQKEHNNEEVEPWNKDGIASQNEVGTDYYSTTLTQNDDSENDDTTGQNKDVICKSCNQLFRTRQSLIKHIQEEHQGQNFPCSECEKEFTRHSNLKTHQLAIHRLVKFPCDLCDSKFTNPSNLNTHKKKQHKDAFCDPTIGL